MLTATTTWTLVAVVLVGFAWLGLRVGVDRDIEGFALAGRGESGTSIGLSFLASGLGAWVLAAPPEIGAASGAVGIAGYAVAVALPLVALALLGTRLRLVMPDGRSLADFARRRYGRAMQLTVAAITLIYMSVVAASELTAAGGILTQLTGVDMRWIIVVMVAVTLAYTVVGGLRASLRTDAWQAWLLVGLIVAGAVVVLRRVDGAGAAVADGLDRPSTAIDIEVAIALVIAVLVTTLFHNGMWQRVWAARDEAALRRGAVIGIATRVPLVIATGLMGVLAVGLGTDLGESTMPVLALLADLPVAVSGLLLVLLVALVASSLDTILNGIGSLVATEVPRIGLTGARVATVVAALPAVAIAFQGWSVVQLLMIANLLCATAVGPALLGLWPRATTAGAVAGCAAGLTVGGVYGLLTGGGVTEAVAILTFAEGPRVTPFAVVIVGSAAVTVLVSLLFGAARADGPTLGVSAGSGGQGLDGRTASHPDSGRTNADARPKDLP